ncbi:MAG: hypothetical protein KME43_22535 [Myxacorys chilensis ATA2-1-KO14]|jgi:hypothetical protein|nr:hypothetical protein [Myxacorys chilensis ATA2-1-KO14]
MQSSESNFLPLASHVLYAQTSVGDTPSEISDSPSNAVTYDAALLLVPIGFVAIWATLVCVISDTWKLNHRKRNSLPSTAQLPCKKCSFFHNNPYVKCAVSPHLALTKDAADCSDFRPRDRKTPSGKAPDNLL